MSSPKASNVAITLPSEAASHLRVVEDKPRPVRFSAVDAYVADVLGDVPGAAHALLIYGYLATAWFEFADPKKLAEKNGERKKPIVSGDWVAVPLTVLANAAKSTSRGSLRAWTDLLSQSFYPCAWGRCQDEHPIIVEKRQGQSKPNLYRKWRCGEDVFAPRKRISSPKLKAAAADRRSRKSGKFDDASLVLDAGQPTFDSLKSSDQTSEIGSRTESEVQSVDFPHPKVQLVDPEPEVQPIDIKKSLGQTSGSLAVGHHEVRSLDAQKSDGQTSLRGNTINNDSVGVISSKTTAIGVAADLELEIDEIEAVACEAVEAIVELGRRVDPAYSDAQAWAVARILAAAVLQHCEWRSAEARAALVGAIASPKLARAENPIGLLRRGIVGDRDGRDRYLLADPSTTAPRASGTRSIPPGVTDMLRGMLQDGRFPDANWLRERDLTLGDVERVRGELGAEAMPLAEISLVDSLEARDPDGYAAALETVFEAITIPEMFKSRGLENPMVRGMCRAQLERDLREKARSGASQ